MSPIDLEKHKVEFDQQGYSIIKNFLPLDVSERLCGFAKQDKAFEEHAHALLDAEGRKSKLTLWYQPGDDVFSRLSACEKMNQQMAYFLNGDVSFFHAKLMQKEPEIGGSWEWHQDYGYWYRDGFLKPDMASCFVALDPAVKANGCLQIIPQSHRYGRIDHAYVGTQTGANMEWVEELERRHGKVYCELESGDAVYFHSNTLHCSGPNTSLQSRLGLISAFFRTDNESIHDNPDYHNKQQSRIRIDQILEGSSKSETGKSFLS